MEVNNNGVFDLGEEAITIRSKAGRPSIFTEALANEICTLMSEGVSLRSIAAIPGMPNPSTILNWQRQNSDFAAKCALAREAQGVLCGEKLQEVNAKLELGIMEADVARVLSSNYQWSASKLFSKRYGDKSTIDVNQKVDINALIIAAANRRLERNNSKIIEHSPQSHSDGQFQANHVETIEDYL